MTINNSFDMVQQEWMKDSLCTDSSIDPEWFFPETELTNTFEVKTALNMCKSCPVRINCLEYAIKSKQTFGIWGGMRQRQIKDIIKQMEENE